VATHQGRLLREHRGVRQVHLSSADHQFHVLCADVETATRIRRQLNGEHFRGHLVRIGYSPVRHRVLVLKAEKAFAVSELRALFERYDRQVVVSVDAWRGGDISATFGSPRGQRRCGAPTAGSTDGQAVSRTGR